MAASLLFAAALVAVAGSTHLSPFVNQYNPLLTPIAPRPVYLLDDSTPSLLQAPAHSRIAQESRLITPQHDLVKHFNHFDAVPAQPNNIFLVKSPINPFDGPAADEERPVEVLRADQPSVLAVNPQNNVKFITPQEAIIESQNAKPFGLFLEDETHNFHIQHTKNFQPQSSVLAVIPQETTVKFSNPLKYLPHYHDSQPSTYLLEDGTPVFVIPGHAKTFQPAQSPVLSVIPQEASVKFSHPQQFIAQHPSAQPSNYFLEDETPLALIPTPAKTIQHAQPSVFEIFPQVPSVTPARSHLLDAPATLIPIYHQNAHQAPALAPSDKHYLCPAFRSFC